MQRRFNVTGLCYPDRHYMVNLDSRLAQIKEMIDFGDYFVINRARQFGKTTILYALRNYLQEEYNVISISFQRISTVNYQNESAFSKVFLEEFVSAAKNLHLIFQNDKDILYEIRKRIEVECNLNLTEMFRLLSEVCAYSKKPMVLLVDEVDSASNNQVFLDFLGIMRDYYLTRRDRATFHSVVLAGVYDIKNLKQKIRPDSEHKYNSPWNIAADFNIDMSFSILDISGMLKEYEQDYQTGMDIAYVSAIIYEYTSGYPYLVSRICKLIHDNFIKKEKRSVWEKEGILSVIKELVDESNMLFDDMKKKIADNKELKEVLYAILFYGQSIPFNMNNYIIEMGVMFGFLKREEGKAVISNRIFETMLYNLFMSEELLHNATYHSALQNKNQFIKDGQLDMDKVLEKFVEHFTDLYADNTIKFLEENARRLFLLYLKPIINGVGNYYVEARTRDMGRTDVIVDYKGKQFIIEMKIWRGGDYQKRGQEQLAEYLSAYHLKKGYLLSFNFNKNKTVGIHTIQCGDKTIVEAVV